MKLAIHLFVLFTTVQGNVESCGSSVRAEFSPFSFITIINNISLCFLDKKIPSFIIRKNRIRVFVVLIHRLCVCSPSGKEFFLITLPTICPGLELKKNEISLFPFTFSLKFQQQEKHEKYFKRKVISGEV
jgi:hypothetical protein